MSENLFSCICSSASQKSTSGLCAARALPQIISGVSISTYHRRSHDKDIPYIMIQLTKQLIGDNRQNGHYQNYDVPPSDRRHNTPQECGKGPIHLSSNSVDCCELVIRHIACQCKCTLCDLGHRTFSTPYTNITDVSQSFCNRIS